MRSLITCRVNEIDQGSCTAPISTVRGVAMLIGQGCYDNVRDDARSRNTIRPPSFPAA
jgi:hypothetical protein